MTACLCALKLKMPSNQQPYSIAFKHADGVVEVTMKAMQGWSSTECEARRTNECF